MLRQSCSCVVNMRMRKVKWAVDYLAEAKTLVKEPAKQKGKWKSLLHTECLHVEIGCGKGNYSLNMAKLYPTEGFVAIEKNESAAGIAAKKFDEVHADQNLALVQEDATNISEWFEEGEVDVIHLNFSDPWPKKRYAKRRLSNANFLTQYEKILSEHGNIQMKTDNSSLFEYSLLEFQQAGYIMKEISVDYRRNEHAEDVMTEYEEKFVSLKQPIYRCVWTRKEQE